MSHNNEYLCVANRGSGNTLGGYVKCFDIFNDAKLIFNINDSKDTIRAVDLSQKYAFAGGKDAVIRLFVCVYVCVCMCISVWRVRLCVYLCIFVGAWFFQRFKTVK